MANLSDKFHDTLMRHTVKVLRYAESLREKITVNLYRLASNLINRIRDASPQTAAGAAFVTKKLETLIKQARKQITNAYADNATLLNDGLRDLAKLENTYYPKAFNQLIQGNVIDPPLTAIEIKTLADDQVILGGPASEWWDRQDRKLQDNFATQMRLGYAQGEGVENLVGRVRGQATGRTRRLIAPDGEKVDVPEFSGGVMQAARQDATALVRTSVQNISNQTLMATYAENDDVIDGFTFLATLDSRVCKVCAAYDRCAWDKDGNPTEDSANPKLPYQIPPIHFSCRCVALPRVKSWADLIKENGGDVPAGLEEVDTGTRASMNGQVPAGMTYEDWLHTQSVDVQQEVLGPSRWELWQKGKVNLGDMVDQSGRALTLDELAHLS